MIKSVVKSFGIFSRAFRSQAVITLTRPAYHFCANLQAISKLKAAVEDEIKQETSQPKDLSSFINYFQNEGWKINYYDTQVELAKKQGPYDLRILFTAKTPMAANQGEEGQQEQHQEEDNQNYTDVSVYIKRDGAPKWLCCEYVVAPKINLEMGLASFIENYEKDREEKQKGRAGLQGYSGPDLASLEQSFVQALEQFVSKVGVNKDLLEKAAQFSSQFEHQFYVQWLKDLRSLI